MNILTRRIREKNFMSNTMKENKMGTMPVNKLLINMALPMMISMLVQALYNIVDSIFVARISEEALTAVSMAFPMQNLMIGVAGGVGVGTNALLSRALGEGKHEEADKMAVKDLNAVLGYIEASASLKNLPVFLYGHSWGGYTAAAVLNFKHNIAGVITISGFSSPMAITKEAAGRIIPTLLVDLLLPFAALYQRVVFGKNYNLSAIDGINSCDVPVLVMHGKEDEVISYEGSSIIAQRSHITNPNVEYYTETRPGKSNHMGIFFTKGGTAYYLAKKEELKMLHDLYYNRVPEKVLSKWFARLDKKQANDLDPLFVKTVLDFLDKNCK